MCGIVGFIDPDGRIAEPQALIAAMGQSLAHRGPDGVGSYHHGPVHFGHRRLAIVDPTDAGRQPFVAGGVAAMANGELYNHEALRTQLSAEGTSPMGASDCAILPRLWRRFGTRLTEEINGMFALAIWDENEESLFLARDAAGQKPLYWASVPQGGLVFASEPRALLLHPGVGRSISAMGLRRFMAFDFVPGQGTIYEGVHKLEAGTSLCFRKGEITVRRFRSPPRADGTLHDLDEGADVLWTRLRRSVRLRLMSDVPLGVFLSGGLDSAAVLAAMSAEMDASRIQTFSLGFDDPAFDESDHAAKVAAAFGTEHHCLRISSREMVAQVPAMLATLDEPFADPSYIPTLLLSKFARQHVKVVLGGDGGDEQLMGYPTFYAETKVRLAQRCPKVVRDRLLLPLIRAFSSRRGYLPAAFRWRRFLSALELDPAWRHVAWIGGIDSRSHAELLAPGMAAGSCEEVLECVSAHRERYRSVNPDASVLEELSFQYAATYLADGVLQKVDRASMHHGLEVRSPLLDPEVLAATAAMTEGLKVRGKISKVVMRHALRDKLPAVILQRPKQGFALPVSQWLAGELRPWMQDLLTPDAIKQAGIFSPAAVQRLIDDHLSGRRSRHKELWTLLSFETWRRGPHGPRG